MKIDYLLHTNKALWRGYTNDVSKIIEHTEDDVFVIFDIGANTGGTSLALSKGFPSSTIHSFEPFLGNYERLCEVTKNNPNIETYSFGFLDRNCKLPIGMPKIPATKSHNYGRTTIHYESEQIAEAEFVKISYWCQQTNNIPDLVWMDIEGCEYSVILDLKESDMLAMIPYFYIEINPQYPESNKIIDLLSDNFNQIHISGKQRASAPKNYLFIQK